jgi:divalent metal cation (Fe/Co/Zn/Cd) transporter
VTTPPGSAAPNWPRRAWWLVAVTLLYNVAEAMVALAYGVADDSVVLFGFGLDSTVEVAAAAAMLYRLQLETGGAGAERVERAEQRVGRFVGVTLLGMAAYVGWEAVATLIAAEEPGTSTAGIVLAALSLALMPLLAWGKLRAAAALGSRSLRAEAMETLACSYLSATLLAGLLCHSLAGWWWADPAAALLLVPWLLKEGIENVRGESCHDDACDAPRTGPEVT